MDLEKTGKTLGCSIGPAKSGLAQNERERTREREGERDERERERAS